MSLITRSKACGAGFCVLLRQGRLRVAFVSEICQLFKGFHRAEEYVIIQMRLIRPGLSFYLACQAIRGSVYYLYMPYLSYLSAADLCK
jgi:hypothetical protein